MKDIIEKNAGTAIVLIVLAAIVIFIIRSMRKEKKSGKSCCGNSCGCCQNSQLCHGDKINNE